MEHTPTPEKSHLFIFPNLRNEAGEIERMGEHFNIESEHFVEEVIERALKSSLIPLQEDMWVKLENTDSTDIAPNDWETVAYHAGHVGRDWVSLKEKMEKREPLDAPIIAKIENIYHLVSGNTRLMISRALGITPEILLVDISDMKTPTRSSDQDTLS